MVQSGIKLAQQRRIAAVYVAPEVIADYVKGKQFGHWVSGLPEDALPYQVFWDQQRASFAFYFVSKDFEPVDEGAIPPQLMISVQTLYPDTLTLWQKIKKFLGL